MTKRTHFVTSIRIAESSFVLYNTKMPFWQIIYFYDYDELADHEMEEKQRVDNDEYEFQDQSTWHWECQRIGNKIDFIFCCCWRFMFDIFSLWWFLRASVDVQFLGIVTFGLNGIKCCFYFSEHCSNDVDILKYFISQKLQH